MNSRWIERVLEAVADRGRELLRRGPEDKAQGSTAALCRSLLTGRGEASGIALAREILHRYTAADAQGRLDFCRMLESEFGPDPDRLAIAANEYARSRAPDDLARLLHLAEPPRQELFRRLNTAPQGTASLVSMRADLLAFRRDDPRLASVEADLKHLLTSWFNRGFLRLQAIDWRSPAAILEKLIGYESVHEIRGWNDLRRRLQADRRCFAFFHPAMPEEPLIFVEVALIRGGLAREVGPLLDPQAQIMPAGEADTAIFYSINNTLTGLRGISFGNFLIKQVLTELQAELPGLKTYATLSPMPRFAETLKEAVQGKRPDWTPEMIEALLDSDAGELCERAGRHEVGESLLALAGSDDPADREFLTPILEQLTLAYLTLPRTQGGVVDPVASFHLSNGAQLARINPYADDSRRRRESSFGVMVNYVYDPEQIEANHEAFVGQGQIALGRELAKAYKRIVSLRQRDVA